MAPVEAARDTASRAADARVSAVSAVGSVDRARRNAPIDPALPIDLRDLGWLRPDPASIPAVDIARFETLVYGVAGLGAPAHQAGSALLAGAPPAHPWAADGVPAADATPADRIAHTLQHLRGIRGL